MQRPRLVDTARRAAAASSSWFTPIGAVLGAAVRGGHGDVVCCSASTGSRAGEAVDARRDAREPHGRGTPSSAVALRGRGWRLLR